jgi:PII-like signaling protein
MRIEHNGTLLRIYVSESTRRRGRNVATSIVEALAAAGIAGAIAFKGIEGFGRRGVLSSTRAVDAWMDLPILIEVIDEEEKIQAFLPALETILDEGLVTLERIQTLLLRARHAAP